MPGTQYGWGNFTEEDLGAFELSRFAGETIDIRFRFKSGWEGSLGSNESTWRGLDGFAVDNITIWKQNTVFTSNVQNKQSTIPMNNLAPNEDYTTAISADFTNATYRISAVLNYGQDQQPANDDIVGYVTAFNLFDPGIVEMRDFRPGILYAEGNFPINVKVEHLGNTNVTFDVEATVYSAIPANVSCGDPLAVCVEDFEAALLASDTLMILTPRVEFWMIRHVPRFSSVQPLIGSDILVIHQTVTVVFGKMKH